MATRSPRTLALLTLVAALIPAAATARGRDRSRGEPSSQRRVGAPTSYRRVPPPAHRPQHPPAVVVHRHAPPPVIVHRHAPPPVIVHHHAPPPVVVHRRAPPPVVVHRRAPRSVVVYHHDPEPRVVVVHRPPVRRVVVHHDAPAVIVAEQEEVVEVPVQAAPAPNVYLSAGVAAFSPTAGLPGFDPMAGVELQAGLLFGRRFGLGASWVAAGNGAGQAFQAGTVDARFLLGQGEVRPYLTVGVGAFAVQNPGEQALVGPGLQAGGGVEIGDDDLSFTLGGAFRAMALDDGTAAQGATLGAGLALRF